MEPGHPDNKYHKKRKHKVTHSTQQARQTTGASPAVVTSGPHSMSMMGKQGAAMAPMGAHANTTQKYGGEKLQPTGMGSGMQEHTSGHPTTQAHIMPPKGGKLVHRKIRKHRDNY